jgi:hypothetical protein
VKEPKITLAHDVRMTDTEARLWAGVCGIIVGLLFVGGGLALARPRTPVGWYVFALFALLSIGLGWYESYRYARHWARR